MPIEAHVAAQASQLDVGRTKILLTEKLPVLFEYPEEHVNGASAVGIKAVKRIKIYFSGGKMNSIIIQGMSFKIAMNLIEIMLRSDTILRKGQQSLWEKEGCGAAKYNI